MSRQVLAFVLSLGFSGVLTWAGFHYADAAGFIGVGLIALVVILFGHSWAFPKPVPVQYVTGPPEASPKDDNERALFALRRARDSGKIALNNKSEGQAHKAFNEIQAAMISIQRQFGIGQLNFTEAPSYKDAVNIYLHYINEIYPRLREGHIAAAKAKAAAFNWG